MDAKKLLTGRHVKRFCIALAVVLSISLLVATVACIRLYNLYVDPLPDFSAVAASESDMRELFFKNSSHIVSLEDMPDYLPNAFLAAESDNYLQTSPLHLVGVVSEVYRLLILCPPGRCLDCRSDITQYLTTQIVGNLAHPFDRSITRLLCGYKLEQQFSKKTLLWIYLNQVYLGSGGGKHSKRKGNLGAYGVEAAAQLYFKKSCRYLTLAESALLAGIPKAPTRGNPVRNPANAIARQKWLLTRMLSLGLITQTQFAQAVAQPMVFAPPEFY